MAVSGISSTSNYYTQAASTGPVSIATALAAIAVNSRTRVTISDTTDNIARNLDSLKRIANNIGTVTQADAGTVIDLTASQWSGLGTLLTKFSTNYQLRVSGVTVANAASTATNTHISSFSVSDTSANIAAQLGGTLNSQSKLSSINISNPATLINVTAAQVSSLSGVIGKLAGNYGLAVTGASASQAVGYTNNLHIKSVAVQDTVAAVSEQLDNLRGLGLRLKEVRGSDSNTFTVTAEQMQTDALVIGKLYRGYQLSVLGANMGQAKALVSNTKLVSVDIVDSAANLSANLDLLKRLGTDLNSIHVTDANHSLTMSSADYGVYTEVLGKILSTDSYKVAISGASVAEAQTLVGDSHVSTIAVSDSSAAIGINLHALQGNSKLTAISQKGKATALNLDYAQLAADSGALSKITDSYSLNVSGATAQNALNLAASNSRVATVSVADSGANITAKLGDLAALGKRLAQISQSDSTTALDLSVSQWTSQIGTLSKITGGYSLSLSGVSAARALTLVGDSRVRSVAVSDSAYAIAAQLDKLHSLGAQLTGIAQTDAANIAVTANQWSNEASTLAKLGSSYNLEVRDALTSQLDSLMADGNVRKIAIADTSSNIAGKLDALQTAITTQGAPAISVRQTGTASPMSITAAQLSADAGALAIIGGNYSLAVSGVSAGNAASVGANGKVASMTVSDTGANLVSNLTSLSSLGNKVSSLSQSDATTQRLSMSASQWATYSNVLGKITTSVRANLSQVKAANAPNLLSDARVASVAVSDSAAQISAHLERLQGLGTLLSTITQSDDADIALTMDQLRSNASTIAKINTNGYTLSVRGASVSDSQLLTGSDYSHVRQVAVSDTSDNIAASLDALQANTKLVSIAQTGTATALAINKAQLTTDAAALAKIAGSYSLAIQDATAGDVASLNNTNRVTSMVVTDTASNIVAKLTDLLAAGNKLSSLRLSASPAVMAMSQSQWLAAQPVLAKIGQNYSVTLSGVSASQAAAIANDPRVATLNVSDSASRINVNLDTLQALGAKLGTVALTDTGTPNMVLNVAQYLSDAFALGKISGDYTLVVNGASVADVPNLLGDSKVIGFSVSDSSDNIAASWSTLNGVAAVTSITQTGNVAPMQISASVFNASADMLAKFSNNYSLIVDQASTSSAQALQSNSHVTGFSLRATTAEVNLALSSLTGMGKLGEIELTTDNGLINLSADQLEAWSGTLGAMQGSYRLNVSGVTIAGLDAVRQTPGVSTLGLSASSQDVSANFDALVEMGSQLSSLSVSTIDTPIALTYSQWSSAASTLSKIQQTDYQLALVDVGVSDLATAQAGTHVTSTSVLDNVTNVQDLFADWDTLGSMVDTIDLTDANPVFQLTQAQYDAGMLTGGLLSKIVGPWDYNITD